MVRRRTNDGEISRKLKRVKRLMKNQKLEIAVAKTLKLKFTLKSVSWPITWPKQIS